MKSKTSLQCIIILLEHYFSIDRRRFSSINYALYCKLSQGVLPPRRGYIPGRCLLLDSTVMLTPKINSGMHTNPYDSHLRQGLTKPIIHRLCLSFIYIDSLLQERQQTLAAHKDSPPFIAYSNYLL